MDTLQNLIAFASTNGSSVLGVAAAFIIFFDRLAKITPTNSDNVLVEKLQRVFALLGVRVADNLGSK